MPTYVYRCEQCGHRFEAWQHMADDPLTTCPECQGAIHRVLFPAGIVFKGSGFYSTDHRPASVATENAVPAAEKAEAKTESTKGDAAKSEPAASTPSPTTAGSATPATTSSSVSSSTTGASTTKSA